MGVAIAHDLESVNSLIGALRQGRARQTPSLNSELPPGALRRLGSKEHLFLEGDKKSFVFQVLTGTIALYRILQDGRRQVLRFAYPGDIIGLGWQPRETCSAQAIDETTVKSIATAALRRAAEHDPRFGRLICEALVTELDAASDHLVSLGQDGANARVARFLAALLERAERRGEASGALHLTMTRADIGDYLGLTLESVSRAFSHLKRRGVIDIERAVNIHILDRAGLESAGSENLDF